MRVREMDDLKTVDFWAGVEKDLNAFEREAVCSSIAILPF